MTYVIESGLTIPNRRPDWTQVDTTDNRDTAYRLMVSRALFLQVMYEPHGGRKLRVREIKP